MAQATQISISTRESDDHKAKIQAREQEDVKQEGVKQEDVKQEDVKQGDIKQEDVKQETQRLERWANAVEDSLRVGLTSQSETLQKAIFINLNQITTALGKLIFLLFLTPHTRINIICCRENDASSQAK